MPTYRFSIVLQGQDVMTEEMADKLYEAGCDDGHPESGEGIARVNFDRDAETLSSAVASAIENVSSAEFAIARVEFEQPAETS